MNIKTIFIDIDTTLVDPRPDMGEDCQGDILAHLVAKNNDLSIDASQKAIKLAEEAVETMIGNYWPFGILEQLNVPKEELWKALVKDAQKRLYMHDDAKAFLTGLKERHSSIKIYTATTNPQMIIYAKLAIGGLAECHESPYLDSAFGGEEVYPGGKSCPELYKALLERTAANPAETLMIGDNPAMDLALAKAAGIAHVALVHRHQQEACIKKDDGTLYLKKLDDLLGIIE